MLLLIILAFCLLAILNYQLGGKALLYPPVVFCSVWALGLLFLLIVGNLFFPMLPETLGIFLFGALAFSAGCWIATLRPNRISVRNPDAEALSNRLITFLFLFVLVGSPFYFHWLYGLVVAGNEGAPFLQIIRLTVTEEIGVDASVTLYGTLGELAFITALMAFYTRDRHPKRAVAAVALSLAMGTALGQKDGPLSLIAGIVCVEWLRTRRVNWRMLGVMALIFIAITAGIEFYVHIGGDSPTEQVGAVAENFAVYLSGGLVGFDQVVRNPNAVPQINPFYAFYLRALRKLGNYEEVPEFAEYVTIGPGRTDNVYTMYWDYLFLGYVGAVLFTGVLGFVATSVYLRALRGSGLCVLVYAVLFRGVLFGTFTDYFLKLYFILKVIVVVWLVYSLPRLWTETKIFARIRSSGLEPVR
jgi:oligosaccharide repeat unit polymerase